MMDADKLLDAMGHVDLALVEAADAAPARRKPWVRPALIAACLCLALVGTALAVEAAKEMVMTEPLHVEFTDEDGVEHNRTFFEIENGIAYIPVDMISDDVWELIGKEEWSMPVLTDFDSWSEGEKFIDLELADNDMLEKAEKGTAVTIVGPRKKRVEGYCTLIVSGSLKAPTFMDLDAKYYIDPTGKYDQEIQYKEVKVIDPSGEWKKERIECPPKEYVPVRISAVIGTENAYQNGAGWQFILEGEETVESYTTANGLETFIILNLYDDGNSFYYSAIFSLNGARFTVNVYGEGKERQTHLEIVKEILDNFS